MKVKLKAYTVISRAVEEGIAYGWNRSRKYTDKPDAETIKQAIDDAVMLAICEVVNFDD